MSAGSEQTEPAVPAPSTPPIDPAAPAALQLPPTPPTEPAQPPAMPSMAAFGGNESCPTCGARMAADQRYCLNCGRRRGDPRLPFMDAVVFMESMSSPGGAAGATPPPPPSEQKSNRMNANAALIAGVATLVLAIGVGFLIGRSGHENSSQAQAPIRVVNVGGGGGGAETPEGTSPEESGGGTEGSSNAKSKGGGKSAIKQEGNKGTGKTAKNAAEGANGQTEAVEKTLHSKVPQAKPEAQLGESCKKGTAGCGSSGKFEGNFFGE